MGIDRFEHLVLSAAAAVCALYSKLRAMQVVVLGAPEPLGLVRCRDPDQNLVEVANRLRT